MISFVVAGVPVAKGRAKFSRAKISTRGNLIPARMYTPDRTSAYEKSVALACKQAMRGSAPLSGPIAIAIEAYMPIRPSWPKRKQVDAAAQRLLPAVKPDFDNLCKSVTDALNTIAFHDDAQIVTALFTKRYAANACLKVRIEEAA